MSMVILDDWLERFETFSDAEFGRLVRAGMKYDRDGTEPALNGNERYGWQSIKLSIDFGKKRQDDVSRSRAEAGRKGAEARWQTDGKNGKCHFANGKNGYTKQNKTKLNKTLSEKEKKEREKGPTAEDIDRMKKMLKEMKSE